MNTIPRDTEDTGYVIAVEKEFAQVRLFDTGNCEDCSAKILCKPGKDGSKEMKVYNPEGAKVGSMVTIRESSNLLLKLGFMQFGLPLLGLLAGILIADLFSWDFLPLPRELLLFINGIAGLVLGGTLTYIWSLKTAQSHTYLFEINKILEA